MKVRKIGNNAWLTALMLASASYVFDNAVAAGEQDVEQAKWRQDLAGKPTQLLVLGSPHLSQLPVPYQSDMIAGVLDKLRTFKPDIITIENLSGLQCDAIARQSALYPDVVDNYCFNTADLAKELGLNVQQANTKALEWVSRWEQDKSINPSGAERRQLAALFLAANEPFSAHVQWLRLPPNERKEGDGMNKAMVDLMSREGKKPNESYDIAAVLAASLGLERVFAVDDHTADRIQGLTGPGFGTAIQAIWQQSHIPEYDQADQIKAAVKNSDSMLALYRFNNTPTVLNAYIHADFGAALKQDTPELYGRQYVAWWETRNLRMVANIREAFGNHPGSRVLSIVGASHKPYFDRYLGLMHDVEIVDSLQVLK